MGLQLANFDEKTLFPVKERGSRSMPLDGWQKLRFTIWRMHSASHGNIEDS
jgi:hypothetical protein